MDRTSLVVPLLNHYKYGLLRRRLIQTILGGPRIRKVPWYIHIIQAGLLLSPLIFSIPFIVVDGLRLWSEQYLLALVYGIAIGLFDFIQGVVVAIVRWKSHSEITEFDDEEDSIKIPSCLGAETIDYVFSRKRILSVLFHPVVSAAFSFLGLYLLLPSVMQHCLPTAGVVIVSLFGWYLLCTAHYSLVVRAPPETAFYRPTDPLELKFLYRPFYIIVLGCVYITLELYITPADNPVYYQVLYGILSLMSLIWILGILPPLDAFVPWVMEQILTRLLGGSPLATDLRLVLAFLASGVSVGIIATLDNTTAFMLLTAFGFLLSHDLITSFKALLCLLSSRGSNRISRYLNSCCKQVQKRTFVSYTGIAADFHRMANARAYLVSLLVSFVKGVALLTLAFIGVYFTSTLEDRGVRDLLVQIFSGIVFGLIVIAFISDSLQKPYFLGIFRNYLFPRFSGDVAKYKVRRKKLSYASIPQRIILPYVAPLIMLVLVGLGLSTAPDNAWQRIAAARLFRGVWQSTRHTLHELAVVSILVLSLPSTNPWITLGYPTNALLVGLALEILRDFFFKIGFASTSLLAFMSNRKLMTSIPLTLVIVIGTFALFPVVLSVILFSSVLLSPLLPLFTLPIFTISFPRPRRFWPSLVDYGSTYLKTTEETVYYQQAEAEMAMAVYHSMSCGSASSQPGTQLLLRFDNRLALVSVLESGYGYCTINTRGLELQETSCHSEEATKIDDMFEALHNPSSRSQSLLNSMPLSTLTPTDSVVIQTYSDAHNVLTGIIDQPDILQQFSNNLFKVLVWIFNRHIKSTMTPKPQKAKRPKSVDDPEIKHTKKAEIAECDSLDDILEGIEPERPRQFSIVAWSGDRSKSILATFMNEGSLASTPTSELPPLRHTPEATEKWLEPFSPEPGDERLESNVSIPGGAIPQHYSNAEPKLPPLRTPNTTNQVSSPPVSPKAWGDPPLTYLQIFKLMQHFPQDWCLYLNDGESMDSEMFEVMSRIVVGCFSALDVPAHSSLSSTSNVACTTHPMDIYKRFCGNLAYSPHRTWMDAHPMLWKLALKAYRYSVKLMYDEVSLGFVDGWEELQDYLEDYDKNWCIARETEDTWTDAILANTPHLFSIGHDAQMNHYTAHVLSLQDEVVHIGTLNPAALKGIWADLALELFYLTNDDEERYSIQAHPNLLRNLSIQTAEPPLGYSVYSSGLVTIPKS